MKVKQKMTNQMESGNLFIQIDTSLKESGMMGNNMVEALLPGLMEGSIQVCSRTANHMGKEHTHT